MASPFDWENIQLSERADGYGYYYGQLPDGRQINVREEGGGVWRAYVGRSTPIAGGYTKDHALKLGIQWAQENPPE